MSLPPYSIKTYTPPKELFPHGQPHEGLDLGPRELCELFEPAFFVAATQIFVAGDEEYTWLRQDDGGREFITWEVCGGDLPAPSTESWFFKWRDVAMKVLVECIYSQQNIADASARRSDFSNSITVENILRLIPTPLFKIDGTDLSASPQFTIRFRTLREFQFLYAEKKTEIA